MSLCYLYTVKIVLLFHEVAVVVISVFEDLHSLSQVAVYVLNSSLTLPVVNSYCDLDGLIREEKNFVNACDDLNVVVGAETTEAASRLQVALKLNLL